jgi:hypothetical protein
VTPPCPRTAMNVALLLQAAIAGLLVLLISDAPIRSPKPGSSVSYSLNSVPSQPR